MFNILVYFYAIKQNAQQEISISKLQHHTVSFTKRSKHDVIHFKNTLSQTAALLAASDTVFMSPIQLYRTLWGRVGWEEMQWITFF